MWIHISKIAKTIIFSTQTDVEDFIKLFFAKTIHNYCRTHRKFAQFMQLYTIQHKNSEKFSPIITKIGIFSSATAIVLQASANCSHTKFSKAAINCSYVYCEEDYGKCYKHTPFFFKRTIVSTGATNAQITKTNKTYGYCKLQHKQI